MERSSGDEPRVAASVSACAHAVREDPSGTMRWRISPGVSAILKRATPSDSRRRLSMEAARALPLKSMRIDRGVPCSL